jgi:tRNA threonylcarbamoyladenosine biosynthesis protein TsaE
MTYVTSTSSPDETKAVAARLGKLLRGGEVIELSSDLGGGKTTFVQGLAAGLGSKETVTSPTFTISRIYKLPALELHHYDLYRLGEAGIVGSELTEDLEDNQVITVIEWAGIVDSKLPPDRVRISFQTTGDTTRDLKFDSGGHISDRLVKELKAS